jgi:beta-1,4-N-acetylglucosaminyltransferase
MSRVTTEEASPKVFTYLERAALANELPDAATESLDVDREAFDLAKQQSETITGRVLLVCSPGGHLSQMLALEPAWRELDAKWVTLPGADVDYLLAGQDVVLGRGPTNRSIKNLIRNFLVAWRTVRDHRPYVILSTGAALAVPFFIVGRLHGRRCVYVESFTRIHGLSWSGRLVYPFANAFFVQWPSLTKRFRKAVHVGSVV